MANLLFIHGFATDALVWKLQINEFSERHKVYRSLDEISELNELVVIGWSMGGLKALQLFRNARDKIKGLVLVSAFPKFLMSEDYPFGLHAAHLKNIERKLRDDFESGLQFFYSLIFNGKDTHPLIARPHNLQKNMIFSDLKKLEFDDERDFLSEINVPTLIIQGETDQIVLPGTAHYLHEKIVGSELQIYTRTGHAPFLDEPNKFNASLNEFISKHAQI